MDDLVVILASVTVVSLISFVGAIFVGLKEDLLRRIVMALVGFASGTLLGGAFFDLLPEAVDLISPSVTIFYFVILGIMVFFSIEKFLHWRHCHEEECEVHAFAYVSLIGDAVHNFIDGMIIAATFVVGFELGFVTTLAVIFHEIPQEIGDLGGWNLRRLHKSESTDLQLYHSSDCDSGCSSHLLRCLSPKQLCLAGAVCSWRLHLHSRNRYYA